MAITRFSPYKREEEIIEKLEKVQGGEWEKLTSISGILADIKRESGRWTVAFLLKWLYRDSMDDLKKDMALLAVTGDEAVCPPVDKYAVLSALWPAISMLSVIDDGFFPLAQNMQTNAGDFYQNERI